MNSRAAITLLTALEHLTDMLKQLAVIRRVLTLLTRAPGIVATA